MKSLKTKGQLFVGSKIEENYILRTHFAINWVKIMLFQWIRVLWKHTDEINSRDRGKTSLQTIFHACIILSVRSYAILSRNIITKVQKWSKFVILQASLSVIGYSRNLNMTLQQYNIVWLSFNTRQNTPETILRILADLIATYVVSSAFEPVFFCLVVGYSPWLSWSSLLP